MVKILFVWHRVPRPDFGDSTRCFHFMRELAANHGYEVALIAATFRNGDETWLAEIRKFAKVLLVGVNPAKNESTRSPIQILVESLRSLTWAWPIGLTSFYHVSGLSGAVARLAEENHSDVVYLNGAMAYLMAGLRAPCICDPHDALSYALLRELGSASLSPRKLLLIAQFVKTALTERIAMPRARLLLVVSEAERVRLGRASSVWTEVLPNGVDAAFFDPTRFPEPREPRLVFFGDLAASPSADGISHFVQQVLPVIRERVGRIHMGIVGRDPPKELYTIAEENGAIVYPNVADVRPLIAQSTCCVVPLYRGTGIKNKVLEAMAMAKPVVTTSTGAEGISTDSDSGLLLAGDDNEFARMVEQTVLRPDWARRLGQANRETVVRHHSWTVLTGNLDRLIDQVIQGPSSQPISGDPKPPELRSGLFRQEHALRLPGEPGTTR